MLTFIIGLREGLEVSLIIGIIAAFLIQRGERSALRLMWLGVGLATVLCIGFAVALVLIGASLPHKQQEIMEGILALVAMSGIIYMVIWMQQHAKEFKEIRHTLEVQAESALHSGSVFALIGLAFFAVVREGIEMAIFMLAAFQASPNLVLTIVGAVLGIASASVLGYMIYRGGAKINLARFFNITSIILVFVAIMLLWSAIQSFQAA